MFLNVLQEKATCAKCLGHMTWPGQVKQHTQASSFNVRSKPLVVYIFKYSRDKHNPFDTLIYYVASSAGGQYAANSVFLLATQAGKMERYCPSGTARFVPANKISPKFKRVHESFLSPKLFSAKVKRFFVISLSLWNQKKRHRE